MKTYSTFHFTPTDVTNSTFKLVNPVSHNVSFKFLKLSAEEEMPCSTQYGSLTANNSKNPDPYPVNADRIQREWEKKDTWVSNVHYLAISGKLSRYWKLKYIYTIQLVFQCRTTTTTAKSTPNSWIIPELHCWLAGIDCYSELAHSLTLSFWYFEIRNRKRIRCARPTYQTSFSVTCLELGWLNLFRPYERP